MRIRVFLSAALVSTGLFTGIFAGCSDMLPQKPAHDFNELIPRVLGAVKQKTPEEAAANLFNVTSPDERRDAVAYLETKPWGHGPAEMTVYETLVRDPHPMVRAQAMRALGTSYQAPAADYLVKGLDEKEDVQVRRDAAYGLITTWNDAAFGPLVKRMEDDPDALVRGYCARALAHARTADSIHALIDAMGDQDAAVTRYAHSSLVAATGQDMAYDTKAWLTWYRQAYSAPTTTAPVTPVIPATGPAAG